MAAAPVPYPVTLEVEPQLTNRNRKTVFFRIFLFLPHALILGGLGGASSYSNGFEASTESWSANIGGSGLSGAVTAMAIVAWFAIIFWRQHPRGLWDFTGYFIRWSTRAYAYVALLRDEFPPFGDGDYPVRVNLGEPPANDARDRWSVGLRIIYAIPHFIVLIFLGLAWLLTVVIAWFAILFTGSYPAGLYNFGVGVLRWSTRVSSYIYLMRDEYPPFSTD